MINDISEEKLLESYHIEDDTNSTYCGFCKCRITIGRCVHGVMPPQRIIDEPDAIIWPGDE